MNLSKTLLFAIDVFFFLLLLISLSAGVFYFYLAFISETPFYIENNIFDAGLNIKNLIKPIVLIIGQLVYLATVFYLRKGVRDMVGKTFFHESVAKNLSIAGVLLFVVSLVSIVFTFLQNLWDGVLKLGMETSILKSEIFMIIIGLFLILMARVVKEGVALKSENDLTI